MLPGSRSCKDDALFMSVLFKIDLWELSTFYLDTYLKSKQLIEKKNRGILAQLSSNNWRIL